MKTHEMAMRLLELPDVPLAIEGWTSDYRGHIMSADMTKYDPEGTAIIWWKPTTQEIQCHKR